MSEYTRLIYMQSNNRYNVSTICGIESYKVEPTRTNPSSATCRAALFGIVTVIKMGISRFFFSFFFKTNLSHKLRQVIENSSPIEIDSSKMSHMMSIRN